VSPRTVEQLTIDDAGTPVLPAGKILVMTASEEAQLIFGAENLPDGASVELVQAGTGQIRIDLSSGTLRERDGYQRTRAQWSSVRLLRIGTNFLLTGDTGPAV
jgi:hypothetical protein